MEGKGRVGKKDTGVEERCKKVGQPQIARRGRREGRIESSSQCVQRGRRKKKSGCWGRKKGGRGKKGEGEREREIVQFFSMAPETSLLLLFFSRKKKKRKERILLPPFSPLFLILVKNKKKKQKEKGESDSKERRIKRRFILSLTISSVGWKGNGKRGERGEQGEDGEESDGQVERFSTNFLFSSV